MAKWQTGDSWLHYNYRDDVSYVYINIPKNASCWMKENFGGYLYDWHNNQFKAPVNSEITQKRGLKAAKHYLVILRDPIDRWITGFAQSFWGGDDRDPNYFQNQPPERWIDLIPHDDHVRPQIGFISGLDHSITTWFDCDHHLTETVGRWMQERFDLAVKTLEDDVDNNYNVSSRGRPWSATGITKQFIIDQLKSLLQNHPEYVERLRQIYQHDYDLRSTVTFHESR